MTYPYRLGPGSPFADVAALPGAQIGYIDSYDVDTVVAGGVAWWFTSTDPAAPAFTTGTRILGCG